MHSLPAWAVREKGELQHFHHQTSKLNAPLQQGSPVTFCRTLCSVTGEESSLRGRGGDGSSFTPQGPSRSVLEEGHSPLHSLLLHYRVFIDCPPMVDTELGPGVLPTRLKCRRTLMKDSHRCLSTQWDERYAMRVCV